MLQSKTHAIANRTIRFVEGGDLASDDLVLWLHAFPLSSAMWSAQLEATRPGWRAVAPDLAGLGGSADHPGAASIDDFARDVDALLDHLNAPRAVIAGLSMGGYAAFACHRLLPARIRGLILADTRSSADTAAGRTARETMRGVLESRGPRGVADEMLPKLLGPTTHQSRPGVGVAVRALIEANTATGIDRAILRLRDRPDASAQLPHISVPALVIVGEEDGITPVDDARALARGIPHASLTILPGAGHLPNLETPDAFNQVVNSWLGNV